MSFQTLTFTKFCTWKSESKWVKEKKSVSYCFKCICVSIECQTEHEGYIQCTILHLYKDGYCLLGTFHSSLSLSFPLSPPGLAFESVTQHQIWETKRKSPCLFRNTLLPVQNIPSYFFFFSTIHHSVHLSGFTTQI